MVHDPAADVTARPGESALHDISILLRRGTPEWPGDTPFDCRWTCRISDGASVNLSATEGSPHVGTHADAPLHVRDGWPASDALPLHPFVGPCLVADVRGCARTIELEQLGLPDDQSVERVLLMTGRTIADGAFPTAWPALSARCVDALVRRGLLLLAVDCPSVDDRESKTLDIHQRLFAGGAFVMENLDLRDVPPGRHDLVALPLRVEGLDAAPVRAALRLRPGA